LEYNLAALKILVALLQINAILQSFVSRDLTFARKIDTFQQLIFHTPRNNEKREGVPMETTTLRKKFPTKEDRAQIGKTAEAIYAPLRERLEQEHWGDYIAVNVENGDYVVAPDDLEASKAIKARYPGIIPYVIRIGYKAVVHFGGTGVSDGIRPEGSNHAHRNN
jgi:hypothetical protein